MSQQPQNKLAALAALIGDAKVDRTFTPQTYIAKNGSVGCGVKVRGAWSTISPAQCLLILQDPDGFQQAALEAVEMAKRPGEAQRLLAAKQAKEQAKATGAPITPARAKGASDLAAALAGIDLG
jgi:hypothetical protein